MIINLWAKIRQIEALFYTESQGLFLSVYSPEKVARLLEYMNKISSYNPMLETRKQMLPGVKSLPELISKIHLQAQ